MWSKLALTHALFLTIGIFIGVLVDGLLFRPEPLPPGSSEQSALPPGHNAFLAATRPESPKPPSSVNSDRDRPLIVVEDPDHDFGKRETGQTVTHQFKFQNQGKSPLRVIDVRAACGCTVARVSATELSPGATAFVEVALNLTRLKGRIQKHLVVETNDPQTPISRFSLQGEVIMHVDLVPEATQIREIKAGESVMKTVRVTALKDVHFAITGLTTSRPHISADFATITPGKEYEVTFVFSAPQVSGFQEAWVHVHTDHPGHYRKIDLPITAFIVGTNPDRAGGDVKSADFETVPK